MMENKTLDSVLIPTNVTGNPVNEMSAGDRKKKTEEGYGSKEIELKRNYDAVSKNGDTLELSEDGKNWENIRIGKIHPFPGKRLLQIQAKRYQTVFWRAAQKLN